MRILRHATARPRRWTASHWVHRGKQLGKIGKWTGIVFAACMAFIVACVAAAVLFKLVTLLFGVAP